MDTHFVQPRQQPPAGHRRLNAAEKVLRAAAQRASSGAAVRRTPETAAVRLALCLVLTVIATGCCTARRIACTGSDRSTQQTVIHTERLRDTVIYVPLPAESRERECERDSSYLETSVACSSAIIDSRGKLVHTLRNKPHVTQPVAVTVRESADTTAFVSIEYRTERVEIPVQRPLTRFQRFLICCGAASLAAAATRLLLLLKRRL